MICFIFSKLSESSIRSDLATPALLGDTGVIEVPDTVHHELEIEVIVNIGRYILVVLHELGKRHFVVTLRRETFGQIELELESVEEFSQHFILGLLASTHVGMQRGIVALTHIIDLKRSIFGLVHDFEGFLDHIAAEFVHLAL